MYSCNYSCNKFDIGILCDSCLLLGHSSLFIMRVSKKRKKKSSSEESEDESEGKFFTVTD